MASYNQYKLLNKKCELYYNIMEKDLGLNIKINKESDKARFGFYIYILEAITDIKDINVLVEKISDTDFNKTIFNKKHEDYGIDAYYIDEDNYVINLFNFKYREKYKEQNCQHKNDVFISMKFINALITENIKNIEGKVKKIAKEIIKKNASNDIWKMNLYMVTNEEKGIESKDEDIERLKELYDLDVKSITLDDISNFMVNRPEPICAKLILDKESALSYTESSLSSAKSYLLKVSLVELVRITCKDKELRNKYNIENIDPLIDLDIDFGVLVDNVRGYLKDTHYNKNIFRTLKEEPSKFFMYNNGITVTAEDIISEPINGNKKIIVNIKNFQVVNGGQTLRTIYEFKKKDKQNLVNFLNDAEILVRVFKTGKKDKLTRKIAEYTNSQNAISPIDLKSLSVEQIEIEQMLSNDNIIYARKIGDTGIESKQYLHKISLEKFAQILFSIQGNPDKASNQKKKLFDKYYDSIFSAENFDINDSSKIVKKYYEVKAIYEQSKYYKSSDQKIFYILYLQKHIGGDIKDNIEQLEKHLKEYKTKSKISLARKLITAGFKKYLNEKLSIE